MKHAIIDIGSNSVRLLMWSNGKTLYKTINTTRLGEGIALNGYLLPGAMSRTAQAVNDFYSRAVAEGASTVNAFATAAVRSASNGKEFTSLVKEKYGIEIDVISGKEEAALGLLGALGKNDGGIIDIGGGSTELTVRKNGEILYSKSLDIGAVRLTDLCGRDREKLTNYIKDIVKGYGEESIAAAKNMRLIGIGGTATSIAALHLNLQEYKPDLIQDTVLTKEIVNAVAERIFACTPAQLTKETCLPMKRAEIISAGVSVLATLMDYLRIDQVTVSEQDNLEGYLFGKVLKD